MPMCGNYSNNTHYKQKQWDMCKGDIINTFTANTQSGLGCNNPIIHISSTAFVAPSLTINSPVSIPSLLPHHVCGMSWPVALAIYIDTYIYIHTYIHTHTLTQLTCHGNFGLAKQLVWLDQYSRKNGPGKPCFPENIGPRLEYWSVLYKLHSVIAVGWQQALNALTSKGTTMSVVLSL